MTTRGKRNLLGLVGGIAVAAFPADAQAAAGDRMFEPILIYLFVGFLVFLLARELACWYWKINQSISLLTEIRDLLKRRPLPTAQQDGTRGGEAASSTSQPK